jgi:hypothetical protein
MFRKAVAKVRHMTYWYKKNALKVANREVVI